MTRSRRSPSRFTNKSPCWSSAGATTSQPAWRAPSRSRKSRTCTAKESSPGSSNTVPWPSWTKGCPSSWSAWGTTLSWRPWTPSSKSPPDRAGPSSSATRGRKNRANSAHKFWRCPRRSTACRGSSQSSPCSCCPTTWLSSRDATSIVPVILPNLSLLNNCTKKRYVKNRYGFFPLRSGKNRYATLWSIVSIKIFFYVSIICSVKDKKKMQLKS